MRRPEARMLTKDSVELLDQALAECQQLLVCRKRHGTLLAAVLRGMRIAIVQFGHVFTSCHGEYVCYRTGSPHQPA